MDQTQPERAYAYKLKHLAQKCLDDYMGVVGSRMYVRENITRHMQDVKKRIGRRKKLTREEWTWDILSAMDNGFAHVEVALMIVEDHAFFQGRNEADRWTDTDKRYLLDAALEKEIASHEKTLATDQRQQAYYSCRYLETVIDAIRARIPELREIQNKLRSRL